MTLFSIKISVSLSGVRGVLIDFKAESLSSRILVLELYYVVHNRAMVNKSILIIQKNDGKKSPEYTKNCSSQPWKPWSLWRTFLVNHCWKCSLLLCWCCDSVAVCQEFYRLENVAFPFLLSGLAIVDFHHVFDVHWSINKADIKVSLLVPGWASLGSSGN